MKDVVRGGKVKGRHYLVGLDRHVIHLSDLAGADTSACWPAFGVLRARENFPSLVILWWFSRLRIAGMLITPDVVRAKLVIRNSTLHVHMDYVRTARVTCNWPDMWCSVGASACAGYPVLGSTIAHSCFHAIAVQGDVTGHQAIRALAVQARTLPRQLHSALVRVQRGW
jgi:hypothetical protein